MTKTITNLVLSLFLSLYASFNLQSQSIWPGDINDNGEVNVSDLLYFGYAYGASGPQRNNSGGHYAWNPRQMSTPWERMFPDSTNFAYADIDGNGSVNERDLELIELHLGRQHDEVDGDILMPPTDSEGAPVLTFNTRGIRSEAEGDYLVVDVLLENEEENVEGFYGLVARMTVPPAIFAEEKPVININNNNWVKEQGERVYAAGMIEANEIIFGLSRINHENISGSGRILRMKLPLAAGVDINGLDTLSFELLEGVMTDNEMSMVPLKLTSSSVATNSDCPLTVAPVCGINGVTYLNGCFAEADGVEFYTAGACYSPGIDVTKMDSTGACPTVYAPVCGFNYVTYANACVAEKAGLVAFTVGQCGANDFSCYDPNNIVNSAATEVNNQTGVITMDCPEDGEAVLGCDGLVYPNACVAEASGLKSYTQIGEEEDCIDTDRTDNDADCDDTVAFVCGCNDVTYLNACYAEAAGLTSFTDGPCGGSSNICDEALPLSCGEFLPNETTIGAGNQLTEYPGCVGVSMLGPDRVYVIQKTTVGDLQIGLEITTPGLDLDLFLLKGECGDLECIGASTTSNSVTNNEGIVLNDAPLGTYYIIVDQQQAGIGGDFRLEVSCGYLDCSDTETLECGVPFQGTNANGGDNVSTYTCGNVLNVENNGPEVIHAFTVNEEGSVTIDLTGLSANLELFLLSSCNRSSCLEYSQKPGTQSEQITRNLAPGTYYVVVDGYNGAVSDYTLTVDCSMECALVYEDKGTEAADCGKNNGVHNFAVSGGVSTYIATYEGPISGSAVSTNGHFCLVDLVPGDYWLTIKDATGCTYKTTFTVEDGGDLGIVLNPIDAGCGSEGSIEVDVSGGQGPYTVYLSGQESGTFTTSSTSFTLNNLSAGSYTVSVVGANGCSDTKSAKVEQGNGNLRASTTPYPAGCGQLGRIRVRVENGQLNYVVRLTGPVTGSAIVQGHNFTINDLYAGAYVLEITDAYGCKYVEHIVVPSSNIEVQIQTTAASCGNPGAAEVSVSGGTPPYTVNYFGPASGTITSSEENIVIGDLPSGSYTFSVWDDAGCDITRTAFVEDEGGGLSLTISQGTADCGAATVPVFLNVNGGDPNYSLTYTGPQNGTASINATGQIVLDIPPGNYTFSVRDFGGCSVTRSTTVTAPDNNLSLSAQATGNDCGQDENITAIVSDGTPPYQVKFTNNCGLGDSTFNLINNQFVLTGLPNCEYRLEVEDANGCVVEETVTIDVTHDNDLLTLIPVGGGCTSSGYIDLEINSTNNPFFITWTGPVDGSVNLLTPTYRVRNLPGGDYVFTITTAEGCTEQETVTLNNGGNLELISSLVTMDCGQYDQIWNDIIGGTPPFTVEILRLCDSVRQVVITDLDGFELTELIPCDYKIKVTDAVGCMVMNTVEVFPYELFDAIPDPGLCGQPGAIKINITNQHAMAPFQVSYTGPQNGSFSLNATSTTINNLPAGEYTITVTDAGGCTETDVVTLEDSSSDLDLLTAVIANDCGQYNQLWNDINGGVPPFDVEVTRLCDNTLDTSFTTSEITFELFDLDSCCYKIKVTDALGCMDMETRCVDPEGVAIFTATPVNGPCGELGRIEVNFSGGTPPFQFEYEGPQSGNTILNGTSLTLSDLPAGTYTLTTTDANGCGQTEVVEIEVTENELELISSLILNDCGQYNQVWNDIVGGTGPYDIRVLRLCDSTTYAEFVIEDPLFELFDLPPCKYKIIVVDAVGCMTMDTVMVFPSPTDLFDLTGMNGDCNELGSFTVNFIAGTPPYTLTYSGPVSDSVVLDSLPYTVENLPSGTYTVIVRDAMDCVETDQVTITNTTTDLEVVTAVIANECGEYNQLWNDIIGGVGPYTVEVFRLCDNTVDTTFVTNEMLFEVFDLDPCNYKVKVTDALGCMAMTTVIVNSTNANLFDVTLFTACDDPSIQLDFIDGTGPFEVTLMSPEGEINYPAVNDDKLIVDFPPAGDYMIIVNSAEGCTEFDFFTFSFSSGLQPSANFDFAVSGSSFLFSNLSSSGTYLWDFGDGETSEDAEPTHTFDTPGTFEVCLQVTNGCGVDNVCRNVTTSIGSVNLDIGEASGRLGQIVSVPVTIQGAQNLATLAGSFRSTPAGSARMVGISPALIEPNFNPNNLTFSFLADNGEGIDLDESIETVLFRLSVEILVDEGEVEIFFTDEPVPLEFSAIVEGTPSVQNANRGSGMIMIDAVSEVELVVEAEDLNGQPISNVNFTLQSLSGGEPAVFQSDANGSAVLGSMPVGNRYMISADKEEQMDSGLSTFGLFVGQRFLLGMEAPQITSPYQIIAGDVNCSNSFSTLDLFLIQQIIVGDVDEMTGCPTWTFVHDSHEMPADWNAQNIFPLATEGEIEIQSDTVIRFTGVKKGDILGAANPANVRGSRAEGREATLLTLSGDLPSASAGQALELQLSSAELRGLASLQFELSFPSDKLRFVDGSGLGSLASTLVSDRLAERGKLRISWYNASGRGLSIDEEEVLTLRFQTKEPISDWSDVFTLASDDFPAEVYHERNGLGKPGLNINTISGEEVNLHTFKLLPNSPNPFRTQTDINFVLPREERVEVTVFDALGRTVLQRNQEYAAGPQRMNLELGHLEVGMYYYRVRAGTDAAVLSMMIQR